MVSHIFVVGLDDLNSAVLHRLPGASQLRFHPLLTLDFRTSNQHSIADMLATAQQELDAFDEPIDAIVGFWDFPVSMMVPILCERYGLRSATLRSVVACEHKYWSRLKQQQIISEIPAFGLLDVTSSAPRLPGDLDFPVWIKPV